MLKAVTCRLLVAFFCTCNATIAYPQGEAGAQRDGRKSGKGLAFRLKGFWRCKAQLRSVLI